MPGINRNIVECKVDHLHADSVTLSSINRNIVECKGIFTTNYRGQ